MKLQYRWRFGVDVGRWYDAEDGWDAYDAAAVTAFSTEHPFPLELWGDMTHVSFGFGDSELQYRRQP